KVLDFGLAKALDLPDGRDTVPVSMTSEDNAQTVLGTAPYMSPEQARGIGVDQRTDIWAFGCVLYEMLTGSRPFEGSSPTEILAHALTREPDLTRLPADTPAPLVSLIEKCLVKDPAHRLPDIGQALIYLEQARGAGAGARTRGRRRHPRGLKVGRGWAVAGVMALAAAAFAIGYLFLAREPGPVNRLAVPIPAGDEIVVSTYPLVAISPDGGRVVYRARRGGTIQLLQRTLERLEPEVVAGTTNAAAPFFSADGGWLAFDGDGALMKVSLRGVDPVRVCDAPGGAVGSWGDDGTIVFATATGRVLQRVRPGSSTAEPLTRIDAARADTSHTFPHVLPGSRAVVFTIARPGSHAVAVARLDTGELRELTSGAQPRFVRTGHLLFARGSTLWAAPFDPRALVLRGEPVPVLDGVDASDNGVAHFAISDNGTLVYMPPRAAGADRELTWFDASGREARVPGGPRRFVRAAASPDGSRIAAAVREGENTDIWIFEPERQAAHRLTAGPEEDTAPLWSPDGASVVFRSARDGGGLFVQDAGGASPARQLTRSSGDIHTPYCWTPDGRTLLVSVFESYRRQFIATLDLEDGDGLQALLSGDFAQLRPALSPDGAWIAYQSDESGRFEVYVRPYPDVRAGRWQVSANGGTSPEWSRDGRQLFYHDGDAMLAAAIGSAPRFSAAAPVRLFAVRPFMSRLGPDYDVVAGPRFLMILDQPSADPVARRPQLVLVQNWFRELRERLAGR
ncbi:MAG TPA: protein kinase, partial [Vicinamibacterales bacterium]|nr:protein kinase [Vicinamibacterales bacterium]